MEDDSYIGHLRVVDGVELREGMHPYSQQIMHGVGRIGLLETDIHGEQQCILDVREGQRTLKLNVEVMRQIVARADELPRRELLVGKDEYLLEDLL